MKVVDMHCDTISELLHIRKQWQHDTMLENHLQIDLNKMQKGDYLLQNFAMLCISDVRRIRFIRQ